MRAAILRPETRVRFSFGYAIDERVRAAILALGEAAWPPAVNGDGGPRDGRSGTARNTEAMSIDPGGVIFALAVVIVVEYVRRRRRPRRR